MIHVRYIDADEDDDILHIRHISNFHELPRTDVSKYHQLQVNSEESEEESEADADEDEDGDDDDGDDDDDAEEDPDDDDDATGIACPPPHICDALQHTATYCNVF